jgi:acetyltransferase-like isoleucine patch superfamily enzyme
MTKAKRTSTSTAARHLFSHFSYVDHILHILVNVLPPIVRTLIFKCIFKQFGKRNLVDYGTYFRYPHKISIGNDVSINRGCQFFPSLIDKDSRISLGDGVVIGPNVVFFSAGQDPRESGLPDVAGSITVERDVYIGGNATIRYGVTIGEGAVVAAGSVVVADVNPYSIVAGVPAREIRKRPLQD